MLTIEYDPAGMLEVTIDQEGIDDLMRILSQLPPGDHDHLFTPSWGAYPLTEEFPNGLTPIHQVNIYHVEPEASTANG